MSRDASEGTVSLTEHASLDKPVDHRSIVFRSGVDWHRQWQQLDS